METLSNTYDSMCRPQPEAEAPGQEEPVISVEEEGDEEGGEEREEGKEEDGNIIFNSPAGPSREAKQQQQPQVMTSTPICKAQVGNPSEDDLQNWGHHSSAETVPDEVMKRVAGDDVSFIFTCEVAGMLPVAPPPPLQPMAGGSLQRAMGPTASGAKPQGLRFGGGNGSLRGAAGGLGSAGPVGIPRGPFGTHLRAGSGSGKGQENEDPLAPVTEALALSSSIGGFKPTGAKVGHTAALVGPTFALRAVTQSCSFNAPAPAPAPAPPAMVKGPVPATLRPAPMPSVLPIATPVASVNDGTGTGSIPREEWAKRQRINVPPPPEVEIMILSSDSDDSDL